MYSNESELKSAPKIFKDTCRIDWNMPAMQIYNLIRGLSPYPAAWSELHSPDKEPQLVKIYTTEYESMSIQHSIGCIDTDNKSYLRIACIDGYINIKEIQLAGKRVMTIQEVLNGYKFEKGCYFK